MILTRYRNKCRWFVLFDHTGTKELGVHRTLNAAKAQEAAINIAKARRAGYRIPRPRT